jgi:DNA polymerase-3 subunit beta
MPVEAAVAAGTMEITVSKFELLRELTATQGVVERKTTIPILSNYLFEAAGDRLSLTATDLDLSLRTSCNAKVKKEGSCTIPARKLAARRRHHHQVTRKSLGQHSLRPLQHQNGRHG